MRRAHLTSSLIVFFFTSLIFISVLHVVSTYGETKAEIFIETMPETTTFPAPGENFTVTVKARNVKTLFNWQVALEFNDTVANITGYGIPRDDNVFKGKNPFATNLSIGDSQSGIKYAVMGALIFSGTVDVTEGTLIRINFTTLNYGYCPLRLGSMEDPVKQPDSFWCGISLQQPTGWYDAWPCLLQSPGIPLVNIPYTVTSGDVTVGSARVPPRASFTISAEPFDQAGLVLLGNTTYFAGKELIFNASSSKGAIVNYTWDFGDTTNTTTSDSVIYHTYSTAGQVTVTLTVGDDSGVVSDPYTQTIKVGLILHALNWFYYTQITAITIIVLVAITAVWKVYTRRFRGKGP